MHEGSCDTAFKSRRDGHHYICTQQRRRLRYFCCFTATQLNSMTIEHTTACPPPYKLSVFWGGNSNKQTLKAKGIENKKLPVFINAATHLKLPVPTDRRPVISDFASQQIVVSCDGEIINTTMDLLWDDIIDCMTDGPDSASMVHEDVVRVLPVKDTQASMAMPGTKKRRQRATDVLKV